MASTQNVAQFLATFCCSLFTGAAVYINLVEHPARMECGIDLAVTFFSSSYRRATVMQATLAVLGFLSSILAWVAGANVGWLIGGILLGSVIPFTLIVLMPTNKRLLDPSLDRKSEQARELLFRWGRLHAVRSVLSFLALAIFLYMLVFA